MTDGPTVEKNSLNCLGGILSLVEQSRGQSHMQGRLEPSWRRLNKRLVRGALRTVSIVLNTTQGL